MTVQEFLIPDDCPECGSRVCMEAAGWGKPPTRVHCGSEHDDPSLACEWSMPLDADPDAESWIIASRTEPVKMFYECPVDDCDWQFEVPLVNSSARPSRPAVSLDEHCQTLVKDHHDRTELALRDHADGHTADEYLITITRLNAELRQLRSGGDRG